MSDTTPMPEPGIQNTLAAIECAQAAGATISETPATDATSSRTAPADVVAELAQADDWTSEELDHLATERPDLTEQIDETRLRVTAHQDTDAPSAGDELVSDADLGAAIQRGLADGSLISYEEFLHRVESDTVTDGDRPYVTDDEDEICL